ncbi:24706_t:CDS:2 [Gigaspora rosea]|nr:24706_t:CDS:2 [Gigaspora rosea]
MLQKLRTLKKIKLLVRNHPSSKFQCTIRNLVQVPNLGSRIGPDRDQWRKARSEKTRQQFIDMASPKQQNSDLNFVDKDKN